MTRSRSAYHALAKGGELNAAQVARLSKDYWYYVPRRAVADVDWSAGNVMKLGRRAHRILNKAIAASNEQHGLSPCYKPPHDLHAAIAIACEVGLVSDLQKVKLLSVNRVAGTVKHNPDIMALNFSSKGLDFLDTLEAGHLPRGASGSDDDQWHIEGSVDPCGGRPLSDLVHDEACYEEDSVPEPGGKITVAKERKTGAEEEI